MEWREKNTEREKNKWTLSGKYENKGNKWFYNGILYTIRPTKITRILLLYSQSTAKHTHLNKQIQ